MAMKKMGILYLVTTEIPKGRQVAGSWVNRGKPYAEKLYNNAITKVKKSGRGGLVKLIQVTRYDVNGRDIKDKHKTIKSRTIK